MKHVKLLGHILILVTVIVWSSSFISTKILLKDFQPIEILFYRFMIAYIMLLIFYPKFRKIDSLKEEFIFLLLGLSGVSAYYLIENTAVNLTYVSNVAFLSSTAPIFTAIVAHIFTSDEKINKHLVFGFIIALTGVFFVVFNGSFFLRLSPVGDALAIAAAIMWGVYSVLLKNIGTKYNYLYITRKIFFYGLVTMLPALFLFEFNLKVDRLLDPSIMINILFLSVVASLLSFVMWNSGINKIGVIKASNYIYFMPFISLLIAAAILKEEITCFAVVGGMLIILGVYISEKGIKFFNPKSFKINNVYITNKIKR